MAGRESDKTRERAMDGLLRHTFHQGHHGQQGESSADPCPDPEILAAYFERSLDDREIAEYELHLSHCARCREQQAAMGCADALLPRSVEDEKPRWAWLWDWRWLAPATAVLVIAAVWYARLPEMTAEKHQQLDYVARSEPAAPLVTENAPPVPENKVAPAPVTPPQNGPEKAERQESSSRPAEVQSPTEKENQADRKAGDEFASNVETDALKKDSEAPSRDASAPGVAGGVSRDALAPAASSGPVAQTGTGTVGDTGAVGGAGAGGVLGGVAGRANEPPVDAAKTKQRAAPALTIRNGNFGTSNLRAAETMVRTPNSQVLWRIGLSGSGGIVERSIDGGATWTRQVPSANAQLAAGSAPTESICWLVGRGGVILLTTNAAEWKTISPPAKTDFSSVAAKSALEATITAASGRRFTTQDGGTTWQTEP